MDDYADDVVVISAAGVVRGKAALRAQLAKMLQPPPATAAVERPKVLAQQYTSEVAWLIAVQNLGKPNEVRGVETFLVRKGKITLQTAGIVSVHSAATAQ